MLKEIKSVSLILTVNEPVETEQEGVYLTRLTHPKLIGSLEFVHNKNSGREELLKAIDQNLIGGVLNAVTMIGDLVDEFKKTTAAARTPTKFPPG